VLSTQPSQNEDYWGYRDFSKNGGCPNGGCTDENRTCKPYYNAERSTQEWGENLDDLIGGPSAYGCTRQVPADAWIYIQSYDEWAEGSTLAPTTYSCFGFLEELHRQLKHYGWVSSDTYTPPPDHPSCEPGATEVTLLEPGDGTTVMSDHAVYRWKSVAGATGYTLSTEVTGQDWEETPVPRCFSNECSWTGGTSDCPANWSWKVHAHVPSGGLDSPVRHFTLRPPTPGAGVPIGPSEGAAVCAGHPAYEWHKDPNADSYALEFVGNDTISKTVDGTSACPAPGTSCRATSEELGLAAAPGQKRWRVKPRKTRCGIEGNWSADVHYTAQGCETNAACCTESCDTTLMCPPPAGYCDTRCGCTCKWAGGGQTGEQPICSSCE
jgi:hypothetical protein